MADARRAAPPPAARAPPPPPGRPTRSSRHAPLVDEDGFRLVVSKRRAREERASARQRPMPARRPVPADLVGRCFNCLSYYHVAASCPNPSRCLRCEEVGHSAKNCKRSRQGPPPARGRGRPVRRPDRDADLAMARRRQHIAHSIASASTASSASASPVRDMRRSEVHFPGEAEPPATITGVDTAPPPLPPA
jgi:hypothetical protein